MSGTIVLAADMPPDIQAFRPLIPFDGRSVVESAVCMAGRYQELIRFREHACPTAGECEALFQKYETPEQVRKHCDKVAAVAQNLARRVCGINLKLLTCAAYIHDATRSKPKHAQVLADELRRCGYLDIASVVETHMNYTPREDFRIDEAALLYLADKLVLEDREVTLDERFALSAARAQQDRAVLSAIQKRKRVAEMLLHKVACETAVVNGKG